MAFVGGVATSIVGSYVFETTKNKLPDAVGRYIPGFFKSNPTLISECDKIAKDVIERTLRKFSHLQSVEIYLGPENSISKGLLRPLFENIFEGGPIPRAQMRKDLRSCSVAGELSGPSSLVEEIVDFIIDEMRDGFRKSERTLGFVTYNSIQEIKEKINGLEELGTHLDSYLNPLTKFEAELTVFLRTYMSNLSRRVAELRINGVEKASQRDSFRQKLEESYIGVFAVPTGDDTILRMDARGASAQEAILATDLIPTIPKAIVRGMAGSGKTTLLQKLILNTVNVTNGSEEYQGQVPIYIPLRRLETEYIENWTIEACFASSIEEPGLRNNIPLGVFENPAHKGSGLTFYLDGLDEVSEANRNNFWHLVESIEARLPSARIIITTRNLSSVHLANGEFKVSNYDSKEAYRHAREQWRPSNHFLDFTLCPLNNEQVSHLIDAWFDGLDDAFVHPSDQPYLSRWPAELKGQLFSIDGTEALRLSRSPLLCALICLVFYLDDGNLPKSRRTLYEKSTNLLLATRDERRRVRGPQEFQDFLLESRESVLRAIALQMQEGASVTSSQSIETSRTAVIQIIDDWIVRTGERKSSAEKILDYLIERCAIIREPAHGRIDFVHRSFMEYLAANEIVLNRGAHSVRSRFENDQWHSTLSFCMDTPTGGTYFAGRLVSEMVDYVIAKAGGNGKRRAETRKRLCSRIVSLLSPLSQYPEDFRGSFEYLADQLLPPQNSESIGELLSIPFEYLQNRLRFSTIKDFSTEVQEATGRMLARHKDPRCAALLSDGFERVASVELMKVINQSGRIPVSQHFALLQRVKNGSYSGKIHLDANDLKDQGMRELISRSVGLRFPFEGSKFVGWDFLPRCKEVSLQYATAHDWEKISSSISIRRFDECVTLELVGCADFHFGTLGSLFPSVEILIIDSCRHFSSDNIGDLKALELLEFRRVSHPIRVDLSDAPSNLSDIHFSSCNSASCYGEADHDISIVEGVVADV